jgi:hypothetical protein
MYRMVDGIKTEREFYDFIKTLCDNEGITEGRTYVEMTCLDNGEDCGEERWTVAINTAIMFHDQGTLEAVARNEG